MYVPTHFIESDLNRLHDLIERYSFGILVSQVENVPFATHLPLLLDRTTGPYGTLIGHTARANPQCSAAAAGEQSVLAIFSGPHAYISPTWYAAENVVPTWNYVAVHATGKLRLIDDEQTLSDIVKTTTDRYERSMPRPWSFDASTKFAERMLPQIIGFRLEIEQIEGKWKLSQNQPPERQEKVVAGLRERADPDSNAVAELMDARLTRSGSS